MLTTNQLTFHYNSNNKCIIENLNFNLNPGEVIGLPGKSGTGKSTLAKLLSGYLSPVNGSITCDSKRTKERCYSPVQYIFQHPELAINPRWIIRKTLEEGNKNYLPYIKQFALHPDCINRFPHELSGGELQRISLIRIMNEKTRYIIADEITGSLDASTQALIWTNLLPWAKKNNIGILAISHDRKLLNRISDKIDHTFIKKSDC